MSRKQVLTAAILLIGSILNAEDFFDICKTGTPEQVSAALKAGACLTDKDRDGNTPLIWAAWHNTNPDVFSVLFNAGASVEDKDIEGKTPLMCAAYGNKNPDIIVLLLKAGADPKLKDNYGKTAP